METLGQYLKRTWKLLVGHLVLIGTIAAVLIIFGYSDYEAATAAILFLAGKEVGELEDDIAGSVRDPKKWVKIADKMFSKKKLFNWAAQGIVLYAIVTIL